MLGFLSGGKMTLSLDKTSYSHGETISGTAKLSLKKPKEARGVFAVIFAERKTRNSNGNYSSQRIFDFSVPLDVEREYLAGDKEYPFQIQVPEKNKIDIEGKVGTAIKAVQALGSMMSPVRWYVEVKLDIPKGIDIAKKQQIMVN
jgi:hypothetical protein